MIRFSKQKNSGLTMVELLIAVTLSLLLLTGAAQVFFGSNPTYRKSNQEIRLQDNGRFSMEVMARDVRLAGYQGCADPNKIEPNLMSNVVATFDPFDNAVRAYRIDGVGAWTPSQPADLTGVSPRNNSDVISVQRASARFSSLAVDMASATGVVTIAENNLSLADDDIVMISDCETVDIFQIDSIATNSLGQFEISFTTNSGTPARNTFSKAYTSNAQVMRMISRTYYTQSNGKNNGQGNVGYSMYQHEYDANDTNGEVSELAEGVEFLRVGLTERIAGGGLRQLTSNLSPADLNTENIIGVQLAMLVQTVERSRERQDSTTYNLLGNSYGPTAYNAADRRGRRIFQTALSIRNRENRG